MRTDLKPSGRKEHTDTEDHGLTTYDVRVLLMVRSHHPAAYVPEIIRNMRKTTPRQQGRPLVLQQLMVIRALVKLEEFGLVEYRPESDTDRAKRLAGEARGFFSQQQRVFYHLTERGKILARKIARTMVQ